MLKKVISLSLILMSVFIFTYDKAKINYYNEKIDNIIEDKIDRNYDGFIYFKSLDNRLLIKKGDSNEILNNNLVLMVSKKEVLNKEYGNIILAGHNNKYVFSKIYKLKVGDEIILSDFNNTYSFTVYNLDYINIKDTSILDNIYDDKILTLITCTYNNQIRYVVRGKIISHNFT